MSDLSTPYTPINSLARYLGSTPLQSGPLAAPTTGFIPDSYAQTPSSSPVDPSTLGVLQSNLPSAVNTFQSKYLPNNQLQKSLSPAVYNALKSYDQIRLQQGKAPLSVPLTADVAQSAQTGQAVTPEPERSNWNILGNAGSDLKQMLGGVVGIPGQIYNTVKDIPNIPQHMTDIQTQSHGDLGQLLGGYLQLPGVNLVPGAYTASNVAKGDFGEIAQHPLMSALDVLPYANKLAGLSPVVKAAEAESSATAALKSEASGLPVEPKQVRAIPTALTRTVDEAGTVQPNLLGSALDTTKEFLKSTKPGELATQAWGDNSRLAARIIYGGNQDLKDWLNPESQAGLDDPAISYMKEVNGAAEKFNVPVDRRSEITQSMIDPVNHPLDVNSLTPDELAYKDTYADLTARSKILNDTLPGDSPLIERFWHGSNETFTQREAKRLDFHDKQLQDYQQGLSYRKLAEDNLSKFKDRSFTDDPNLAATNVHSAIDALTPLRRSDPVAHQFINRFNAGKYQEALSTFRKMKGAKWDEALGGIDRDGIIADLQSGRDITKQLTSYKSYNDRGLATRTTRTNTARDRITPARFGAIQDEAVKSGLKRLVSSDDFRIQNGLDDPTVQQFLSYVDNGDVTSLIGNSNLTTKDYVSVVNEAKQTVADMAEQGVDPTFLHRVNPNQAKATLYPTILDNKIIPSATKARGIDITPYVPDFQVALSHQGLEYLQRMGVDQTLSTLDQTMGIDKIDLWNRVDAQAQQALARNPSLDVNAYKEKLVRKAGYVPFDTDAYSPWTKSRTTAAGVSDRYIPAEIAANLKRLHEGPGKIAALFDPIMNVFRTSVLPLSPRWLVNNIFSGIFLSAAEGDPLTFAKLGEAYRMVKSGELEQIPGLRNNGAGGIGADEIKASISKMTDADRTSAIYRYKGGQFLRRMLESDPATKILGAKDAAIQGAFNVNQFTDDLYRGMTYLREHDKAIKSGATESEAGIKAASVARRIMQNFDELTPLERTTLRNIFPFYGFMQHMVRFTMRYPFDHPIRTAVIGSFARNELKDLGTGLPQDMMSMIFLGGQDENGNQKMLNLNSANPFSATGDLFSLAGLLQNSNPIAGTVAESLGLDPISGTADLYPNVKYNPETGKMEAQQGNFAANLLSNTVPLSNLVGNLLPNNQDFKNLLRDNPAAAGRQLFSSAGLPMPLQSRNIPQEIIKAESNRVTAQNDVKSEAMRSGDYSEAQRYPALNAWVSQLSSLQAQGKLKAYSPVQPSQVANPATALLSTLNGNVPAGTVAYQNQLLQLGVTR